MAETTLLRTAERAPADRMRRLARAIGLCRGWRRNGIALLLGLAAASAMPPFNAVPMLLPAFTGLIWLLDGAATGRRAFFDGWLWGMGFLVPGLYWICLSMVGDLAEFWWFIPVTIFGLPAFLSLYIGAATMLARRFGGAGMGRILIFAACWVGGEWLRGHAPFGGFPWALIGYTWSGAAPILLDMLQAASVVGVYGLSLVTVLVAALPATLGDPGPWRRRIAPVAAGAMLVSAIGGWGVIRLLPGADAETPGVTLRLVQTDVPNSLHDTQEDAVARLRAVFAAATSQGADAVTAQIWPESSVDTFLDRNPSWRSVVATAAPADGVVLTGTLLTEPSGERVWNSIAEIDRQGALTAHYDKAHLVPFGEYVPFYEWLRFVPLVAGHAGFSTGPGAVTLDAPNLPPVAPIICYEAIFPHAIVDEAHRPAWIMNVTNDAWFGASTGPSQHFAQARVRAVEEGLPLVRAANGGISGVIDAHGRIVEALPLGTTGILDVKLPVPLPERTPYARFGDWIVMLLALAFGLAGSTMRRTPS